MTQSAYQNWQQKVRFYFEDIETPVGKAINLMITGMVLLSSAIFVAETYPISASAKAVLAILNNLILVVFTIEYILRFWSAEDKLRFVFNPYSLIDLVAILPFLFTALDIRFIRIFRWFRILRLIRFFEGRTTIASAFFLSATVNAECFICESFSCKQYICLIYSNGWAILDAKCSLLPSPLTYRPAMSRIRK
ncbi:ion transporter [Leptolyngbya sp. 7M]|uniref:ion transporter n=1 Tax=Leptolyngbya sp. 7M TaxID=2812896 RepID=UPI001B8B9674|nr:ion transporter [Leptolyngbya sp. 7M]QYO62314.1 ion transporter [Leptolyngbya sp. 7M]